MRITKAQDVRSPKPISRRSPRRDHRRRAWRFAPALLAVFASSCFVAAGNAGESSPQPIPVRGVIRAVRQASIATDAALRAIELPYRESDSFKRNDTLVVFDCRRQNAEHQAAVASEREARLNLESNVQLDRHRAVGKNDVEIARARADKARADSAGIESRLDECRLIAPFDGRIAELTIRLHERTVPQRPFISIIDDSEIEIELIAPAGMLQALQPGSAFAFQIDELGGQPVAAEVAKLGAGIDPVSKTVKVIGVIKEQLPAILSGMSGTAVFRSEAKP